MPAMLPELHTPSCEGCVSPYRSGDHAGAGTGIPLASWSGVHLVEVLIASSLLAAVCTSLPAAFAAAAAAGLAAGQTTVAVILAAQKVEEFRAAPFAAAGPFDGSDLLDAAGRVVEGPSSAPAFRRVWRTEWVPASSAQTLVITVLVAPYTTRSPLLLDTPPRGAARLVTVRTRKAA